MLPELQQFQTNLSIEEWFFNTKFGVFGVEIRHRCMVDKSQGMFIPSFFVDNL